MLSVCISTELSAEQAEIMGFPAKELKTSSDSEQVLSHCVVQARKCF